MAKRFTDTDKWSDPWFLDLDNLSRIFWLYICDKCDTVGIYKVHYPTINFQLGEVITRKNFDALGSRIKWINEEKIWITGFIFFQYGNLSHNNTAHRGIMKKILQEVVHLELDERNLRFINYLREGLPTLDEGLSTPKEKEEEKVKVNKGECEGKNVDNSHTALNEPWDVHKAISHFGRYNGPQAAKVLTKGQWEFIQGLGGWSRVCEMKPNDLRWALKKFNDAPSKRF